MANENAIILDVGMITSVGLNALQTAASVRAGISRFAETSIYDKRFEPFTMAILPDDVWPPLVPELEKEEGLTARQIRMLRLATSALKEVLKNMSDVKDVPIYLGVPEQFAYRPKPVVETFFRQLRVQSEVDFNVTESKLFLNGRAAGLVAMKEGLLCLASGKCNYVLVGGVDTYLDLYLLGILDMEGRILGRAVMDGFVPGEGAAFVLLSESSQMSFSPLASLSPVSTGFEEGHMYSEEPYQGEGLAVVFENLFSDRKIPTPMHEVYSAMNGENIWAKEWGVAFLRNRNAFDAGYQMHHPADCIGDTGAASGIILTILAAIGFQKGYRQSPALVTCSSDLGHQAAVAVMKST
ncbi:MAG: beta-ketoacyl synthase N-terminal-like domain-containing protein [Syntrophaceae bacterium]